MGTVSKDELPYIYSKANLGSSFVINNQTLWDNSANKFFDTLAAGKPMLINHQGWQAETIQNNNCGYVLPAKLDAKAASDFVNYLNDDTLLKQQSVNALSLAKGCYSLEIATSKYLEIFKKIDV